MAFRLLSTLFRNTWRIPENGELCRSGCPVICAMICINRIGFQIDFVIAVRVLWDVAFRAGYSSCKNSRCPHRHFSPKVIGATGQNGIRANRKFYREQRVETFLYISGRAFIGTRPLSQRPPPDKCGHRANWQSIRTKSTAENIFPPLKLFALPGNKFTFVPPFRAWSPNRASSLLPSCFLLPFPWHPYSCRRELLCGQSLRQRPTASSGTSSYFRLRA